jgi:hypothetical protein
MRTLKVLGWLFLSFALLLALRTQLQIIFQPFPLESREPAQVLLTQAYAQGNSPDSLESFPGQLNAYGPFYNRSMALLLRLGLPCSLGALRAVSAVLTWLLLALLFILCLRLGADALESASLCVGLLSLLLLSTLPLARPDALALLFFAAALALASGKASPARLVLAALACSLAAACKLYFVLGAGFIFADLLVQKRFKTAFGFAAGQALLLGLALWLLERSFPLYLYEAYLANRACEAYSLPHMLKQLHAILLYSIPLWSLLGLALLLRLKRREGWALWSGLGLAAFVFPLGGNEGALYAYAVQWVALPLAPALASALGSSTGSWRRWAGILLALNAAWAAHMVGQSQLDPSLRLWDGWRLAERIVAESKKPLVLPALSQALVDKGLPVEDFGMGDYYLAASTPPEGMAGFFPRAAELRQRGETQRESLRQKLVKKEFDVVLLAPNGPYYFEKELKRYYHLRGVISLPFPRVATLLPVTLYTSEARSPLPKP